MSYSLSNHGISVDTIKYNPSVAELVEWGLKQEDLHLADSGALVAYSGEKTGRSPQDKRVVESSESFDDVWWGPVNKALSEEGFDHIKTKAIEGLNSMDYLFCLDAFAGWDESHRIKVRVVCTQAYHALFMRNMLVMPTPVEQACYGKPDMVIYNAGSFDAPEHVARAGSKTSVVLSLETKELVIMGTGYAGEMKKGVFTLMNYLMPKQGHVSMHCSATTSEDRCKSTLLFGLSGTGKTTLSADPHRLLVGDDEHVWTGKGIFNIEGGCYAKAIGLTERGEPDIYNAICYGAVLENVVYDKENREVNFEDTSITQNTRASYPLKHMKRRDKSGCATHPNNVIFLTCDAFGVLPAVSKLTPEQAMYHFISGYTAKVAGTEIGVVEPQATFSPCFGGPFLVWHPMVYAKLLAEKVREHHCDVWLINTGWAGGGYGVGKRMPLSMTRTIVDRIHDGSLAAGQFETEAFFGLRVPAKIQGVNWSSMMPASHWADTDAYQTGAQNLVQLFTENFKQYADQVAPEVLAAGPVDSRATRKAV